MNAYIMLNYVMYEMTCVKYYLPLMTISLRHLDLICDKTNSITILILYPRVNIDMISSQFQFYFPTAETLYGQVHSHFIIVYNTNNPGDVDKSYCILNMEGMHLIDIILYLPNHPSPFLKELRYRFHQRSVGGCPVCFEENVNLINLHNDAFNHSVCEKCLLQINKCPFCRTDLLTA